MAFFDLPREELEKYLPERNEPHDFDRFWRATLDEAHRHQWEPVFTPVDIPLEFVDVFDVSFSGFRGEQIKGWLLLPRSRNNALHCVVEFIGYGGGRGFPMEHLAWVNAGFAHFVMDNRGQGSTWSQSDTPDVEPPGSNSQYPGFMTRGVLNPDTYYYRRLITDAVRAVETMKEHPAVNASRIAITGGSQGGGVTIAVSGLLYDIPVVMPDVPFLCHYRRAVQIVDSYPYQEIVNYCRVHRDKTEQVFGTLSYFDGLNFAVRARGRALFSTALMDETCPPSTVFAAYNHYAGLKEMAVYPFNQHDGGGIHHLIKKINFLKNFWL
jgi:cephalosporin-C deacetylase